MELPQDFKERMRRQLGDSYPDFLAVYGQERVYGLRCNPLKITKEKLTTALYTYQIPLEAVPWAKEGFYYPAAAQPGKLPLHEAGAYYIQEPSAMIAAELLDAQPGETILDLCAAPGGKSTQIAGQMQGRGLFVSNEIIPARAKTLSRNIERMGIVNAVVFNETPKHLSERFPVFFDRILVDAPCSGEGMFRKDVNARGEWSLQQVKLCAGRQREILSQAAGMLKPGGRLVYSTCTFSPEENECMAEWFVQNDPQFSLVKSEQILPHLMRGEGHYAACFQKEGTTKVSSGKEIIDNGTRAKTKFFTVADYKEVQRFCRETLSEKAADRILEHIENGCLAVFGDQLFLLPSGIGSLDGLKTERAGLQLGSLRKNRFVPSHALAMALHPEEGKQVLELKEPERYLRGETAACGSCKGWTLATVEGCSIGWGKASQGILKNHYPKGLRRG